jgi:4'-phosphopantetheinyl transferase EntD
MKGTIASHLQEPKPELSPRFQALFPPGAVAAELRGVGRESWLSTDEAEAVKNAVPKRVREFAAGRACARRALRELGIHDSVIRVAPDRQPVWPEGTAGSISHTTGLCAAVVAPRHLLPGLGVDCEVVGKVGRDLWPTICGSEEAAWCSALPVGERHAAVALIFSAKEAFYKCQYPLTAEWLDFHDIRVEPLDWGSEGGQFQVHSLRSLCIAAHGPLPVGRYTFNEGFVTTGVALLARSAP